YVTTSESFDGMAAAVSASGDFAFNDLAPGTRRPSSPLPVRASQTTSGTLASISAFNPAELMRGSLASPADAPLLCPAASHLALHSLASLPAQAPLAAQLALALPSFVSPA